MLTYADVCCGILGGTVGRGLSYFDWYGRMKDELGNSMPPNVRLVQQECSLLLLYYCFTTAALRVF
jgi:hypothetical protein